MEICICFSSLFYQPYRFLCQGLELFLSPRLWVWELKTVTLKFTYSTRPGSHTHASMSQWQMELVENERERDVLSWCSTQTCCKLSHKVCPKQQPPYEWWFKSNRCKEKTIFLTHILLNPIFSCHFPESKVYMMLMHCVADCGYDQGLQWLLLLHPFCTLTVEFSATALKRVLR